MTEIDFDEKITYHGVDHLNDHIIRKNPYGKHEGIFVFLCSLFLSIAVLITIGILQYDVYDALLKIRLSYIKDGAGMCVAVDFHNFDILTTPFAAFLLIIFIFLYKRRVLCVNKCSWKHIGLPMIVSLWNKTDRTLTGIVYGRIAYEVFRIVQNLFQPDSSSIITLPEPDPTGLFKLLMRIIEVILIGLRYYPVLVAFRAKSCLIYFLTAIYMWVDLADTIYQQGKCESFAYESEDLEADKNIIFYWIAYKVLNVVPTVFLATYIAVNLTYRALVSVKRIFKRNGRKPACMLCNINDDYEIIYSHSDILYVLNLFHNQENCQVDDELGKNVKVFSRIYRKIACKNEIKKEIQVLIEDKLKVSMFQKIKKKIESLFRKHVYDWHESFRFTSRFVNCHVVALLALYHVFMLFLYYLIALLTKISSNLSIIDLQNLRNLTIGDISCFFGEEFCIPELNFRLPLPEAVYKFGPELIPSIYAVVLAPMFAALIVCIVQVFIGIRDSKKHLLEIYKGKCFYLPPIKTLANSSIASSSFHFGGYLVGYLVWGFFILYAVTLLVGIVIVILRLTVGDNIFLKFLLKIIPVICVLIVKMILNMITSRVIFLRRDTKVLALNNFRVFNVFLYFNFFFDCFMGVISALIRILKSVIAAIIMMPRIAYSFMGRHLERMDNGN
jgi:hypothetical protein